MILLFLLSKIFIFASLGLFLVSLYSVIRNVIPRTLLSFFSYFTLLALVPYIIFIPETFRSLPLLGNLFSIVLTASLLALAISALISVHKNMLYRTAILVFTVLAVLSIIFTNYTHALGRL